MIGNAKQAAVGYTGIVKLTMLDARKLPIGEKTIKNNGVNNLFKLLCDFIVGNKTGAERLPHFLAVGNAGSSGTTINQNQLQDTTECGQGTRFPLITTGTIVIDSDGTPFVEWSTNIPFSSVGSTQIKEMGLFPTSTAGSADMLARIIVQDSDGTGITLTSGNSLLVNWRMYFTNKTA